MFYRCDMLSVLIAAREEPVLIASTLASLVPGAVEGLIGDVVLVDEGMGPEAHRVADHAGCRVRQDPLPACIAAAKGDWILFLEAGARPAPGWVDEVSSFLADAAEGRARSRAARFRVARQDRPLLWAGLTFRRSPMAGGLIARKADAVAAITSDRGMAGLVRSLRPMVLSADMRPRPPDGEPQRRR